MSIEAQAAEIEILYLRGVLPREIQVPREPIRVATQAEWTGGTPPMRHGSEPQDLSVAETLQFLVALPKPLRCRGRLWRGRLSLIAGVPTAEQLQLHDWARAVPAIQHWQKLNASVEDPVLIKSGLDAVTVSFGAFDRWQHDYVRAGSTSVVGPTATKDPGPGQPRWTLGVGGAGPVGESYSLDADESVLCDRCRQQLAVAVSRDRATTPVAMSLLCEDCLRANVGREFAKVLGVDPQMSDADAHKLLDDMLTSLQTEHFGKAERDERDK